MLAHFLFHGPRCMHLHSASRSLHHELMNERKKKKKRARSDDDVAFENPVRSQGASSSQGTPATGEEEPLRNGGKHPRHGGGNHCRTRREYWLERLDYQVIRHDIAQGCSCKFNCVAKLKAGRVFDCRGRNANKSSTELSSDCLLKLDHCFNRDLGTMSYTTENGASCCRKGFQIEQGFAASYIHRKVKKVLKGEIQDADRGGTFALIFPFNSTPRTFHAHFLMTTTSTQECTS